MERFVIIVNGYKSLTIITKRSILDVAAVLVTPLLLIYDKIQGYSKSYISKKIKLENANKADISKSFIT